jgi:hypothetical protein
MKKIVVVFSILILLSLIFTSLGFATQTAFWRPYTVGPHTYGLFPFNRPNFSDYYGDIKGVKIIGNVNYYSKGKFGGCARFTGNGAIEYIPDKILKGNQFCSPISVEAWIKIKHYPVHKEYIVYRPAIYNPAIKRVTNGFALYINSKGGFSLSVTSTVNAPYGTAIITSSPEGIIPLNKWVHISGMSGAGLTYRRLYLNGKLVTQVPIVWGQWLSSGETQPGLVYIGNNEKGTGGFSGLIDEVRIDQNVFALWPKDTAWTKHIKSINVPKGPPYFLSKDGLVLFLPLNGNSTPEINRVGNIQILTHGKFVRGGIGGECFRGNININKTHILSLKQGSVEFWLQPYGVTNYSDFNVNFLSVFPGFIFYILNNGYGNNDGTQRPLSIYFTNNQGNLVFINADNISLYEGRWYQIIITWKGQDIKIYIDGKQRANEYGTGLNTKQNGEYANDINFPIPISWEHCNWAEYNNIYIYNKALTREEVWNAYYRYRDPAKLKILKKPFPVTLRAQYFPSYNLIYYKLIPNIEVNKIENIEFKLNGINGTLFKHTLKFTQKEEKLHIPVLKQGKYKLELFIKQNGRYIKSGDFTFVRQYFIWEHNKLGITDKVFKPFTPVIVNGKQINIVLRKYTINNFGLLNSIISKGKEILAGPMEIKGKDIQGEINWTDKQGKFIERKQNKVVYQTNIKSDPINITTKSTIWFDGTIKVNMEIKPGQKPILIKNLYLYIPLKEKYAYLFHTYPTDHATNPSKLPKGTGIIWNSTQVPNTDSWLDSFVPYIWIGQNARGLAWFGDNDKGWITAKNMKIPIQTIERKNGKVILKVYLIDEPIIIKRPTKLVFGLDISPTKPMPSNWREHLRYIPFQIGVAPWGGLNCSYKGPYKDHWSVVDKIMECREQGKLPENIKKWFEAFYKKYNPPPVFGTGNWLESVLWDAGVWAAGIGPDAPCPVYEEELYAPTVRAPWKTYQYEWTNEAYLYNRKWPTYKIFLKGVNVNPSAAVTYVKSYRDYGLWYANQWLKRGVSLYWDNTYPRISYNYRTTDAYKVGNEIQPCFTIWQQRKYMMRVWNLLSEYREKMKHPWLLQWIDHMTDSLVLPLQTFGTADLDLEFSNTKPFAPSYLRTESIGRQVGNYPLCLYPVSGDNNKIISKLPEPKQEKIEWAMRMVHEIEALNSWQKTTGDLNKIVFNFGYGKKDIKVDDYWKSNPILQVNNRKVKWIGMINKSKKEVLLVFSSWNPKTVNITVKLNNKNIGFNVDNKTVINVLTGKQIENNTGQLNINLSAPYGVKLIKIE